MKTVDGQNDCWTVSREILSRRLGVSHAIRSQGPDSAGVVRLAVDGGFHAVAGNPYYVILYYIRLCHIILYVHYIVAHHSIL